MTVGTIFTIYSKLEPSVFSLGGIVLALGMLAVAKFYEKILKLKIFFQISLFVELVMLVMVVWFLIAPYGYVTALLIYAGYQVTFMFGSYLIRAETIFLNRKRILSWLDMAKQAGYLGGMLISWLFYKLLENYWSITDHTEQVYMLHWLLLFIEVSIIFLLLLSFEKIKVKTSARFA